MIREYFGQLYINKFLKKCNNVFPIIKKYTNLANNINKLELSSFDIGNVSSILNQITSFMKQIVVLLALCISVITGYAASTKKVHLSFSISQFSFIKNESGAVVVASANGMSQVEYTVTQDSPDANVDLSRLSSGVKTVSLVVNGQVADSRNITDNR